MAHAGEPTWYFRFGPIDISIDNLTQISFPRNAVQEEYINDILTQSIADDGLLKPLEVEWWVGEYDELRIFKGNQRIQALRNLKWQKVPCVVTIRGYEETKKLGEVLEKILTP